MQVIKKVRSDIREGELFKLLNIRLENSTTY